ncbi:MAG TPA: leucyl aminopeptidase [Thermoanaerobaculia bacterium]|jgi:leucyl aminopeptidase
MRIRLTESAPRGGGASARIALLHEGRDPSAGVRPSVRAAVRQAVRAARFRGEEKEVGSAGSWTLLGLGKAPASPGRLRAILRRALKDGARSPGGAAIVFDGGVSAETLRALLPQIASADYRFDRYKSRPTPRKPKGESEAAEKVVDVVTPPGVDAKSLAREAERARALAQASAWARDLGNTPGNDLGPREFAREAGVLAKRHGLRFEVLDKAAIEREKMGGLLGVNAGSARPPVFLIGEYAPKAARGTAVLVGKGITFDSGGISLKPAASMGEMKYDMMGAATAFACLAAAKELALPVRLVALAPVTENMPGGSATRPGDILRMRNGKTVEVDNTDAEGRLILGDALSYAEKFRPDVMIDFATLTGAVLIALGSECAGLMTPDDRLARELTEAGESTGERVWRLPLWSEYRENLKSEWADMRNTGGRSAGTINAGVFLSEFVPPGVAWAHVDIAGVAHFEREQGGWPAGATGFGVALAIEFLQRRFGSEGAAASGSPRREKPRRA